MKSPPLLDGREEQRGYDSLYLEEMQVRGHLSLLTWSDKVISGPNADVFRSYLGVLARRSGKGSCSAAGAPGDDMDDTRPCQLYILSDIGTMLVARGTVYETATVVHGVQLAEDEVKVILKYTFLHYSGLFWL
ncbi:hypothetical protein LR48_Vigan03g148600 [Vigna angularis]|uniref:DUF8039 domain-containing protein n=1 Tax=Phaseolus angularis TaxID=3914 RepID=A0A0L9U6P3_PHAAN|nr:hypothetical protein LR48_Vigan03g148600 [Vigna angularis]